MANKKQVMVEVILDREGVRACGKYMAGKVYQVADTEASRLVDVKGFRFVNDEGKN